MHLCLTLVRPSQWSTGQDANATIKRQLQRLLLGVSVFLDVDDLKEIGDLELYIDQTLVINIFLSHWYFKSKNCLREVQATVDKDKPIMCTHEIEKPKGGGPLEDIKAELDDQRLKDAVFARERQITIWYRIADFQLISLKQLAAFTLQQTPRYAGTESLEIYVPRELLRESLGFEMPVTLYTSPNNPGVKALATELQQAHTGISTTEELNVGAEAVSSVSPTHFLLYLNHDTYLEDAGKALAEELRRARVVDLPIVMAHENDDARGGCEFALFFSTTPGDLISGGLYKALAFACYPGLHRAVSMALLAKALGAKPLKQLTLSKMSVGAATQAQQLSGPANCKMAKGILQFRRTRNTQVVTATQVSSV